MNAEKSRTTARNVIEAAVRETVKESGGEASEIGSKAAKRAAVKSKEGFFGLEKIEKTFGQNRLYDTFSLSLPKGAVIAVTGPSGCGKTTFLRMLAGLEPPDGGRVFGLSNHRISFLFQEDRLFPWLTVEKNIQMVLRSFCGRKDIPRRVEEALAMAELTGLGRAYPRELSGGMRRRAALARALAYDVDVMLMDEPFTALDKALRDRLFLRMLEDFQKRKKTVLLVTHDEKEASLADLRLELTGRPVSGILQENGTNETDGTNSGSA